MNYLGWAPRLSYSIEQVNIASPRECPPLLLPNPILLDNMRSSFWCRQLIGGGKGQGSHRKGHRWSWKALPAPLRPIWWALHPQGPRVFFGSRRRAQQLGWSVSTCCLVEFGQRKAYLGGKDDGLAEGWRGDWRATCEVQKGIGHLE